MDLYSLPLMIDSSCCAIWLNVNEPLPGRIFDRILQKSSTMSNVLNNVNVFPFPLWLQVHTPYGRISLDQWPLQSKQDTLLTTVRIVNNSGSLKPLVSTSVIISQWKSFFHIVYNYIFTFKTHFDRLLKNKKL